MIRKTKDERRKITPSKWGLDLGFGLSSFIFRFSY